MGLLPLACGDSVSNFHWCGPVVLMWCLFQALLFSLFKRLYGAAFVETYQDPSPRWGEGMPVLVLVWSGQVMAWLAEMCVWFVVGDVLDFPVAIRHVVRPHCLLLSFPADFGSIGHCWMWPCFCWLVSELWMVLELGLWHYWAAASWAARTLFAVGASWGEGVIVSPLWLCLGIFRCGCVLSLSGIPVTRDIVGLHLLCELCTVGYL